MSLITKFLHLVKVRPEESRSFRFLFMLSLITGIALSFYFVAVNSFLIQHTSVSNLPYAYIISGLGGVLLIKIYQSRQRKVGIIRSYQEFLATFSIMCLVVFFAYQKFGAIPNYAVYLAYFGFLFNMPFTIIFALSFSAICARLYNLSQSKRLLALIGTGEIIASIVGYLSAPLISKMLGNANFLLPVASVCILPVFYPLYKLATENADKLKHQLTVKGTLKKLNVSFFLSQKFYLLIALVSIFSVAAIYFVDYACLITVRFMASYSGLEIAVIVGVFFSCVKTGELIFSFMSGHILSSKGVKFAILILPLLLVGCFIFAAIGGAAFRSNPVFILCFIFLAKFVERVIRKALTAPATKVLYQVTGNDRLRIEATIEGLLNQVATVLSGLLLLLISALLSKDDTQQYLTIISGICFAIFFTWSFLSLKLYDNYKKKIWSYLTTLRSVPENTPIDTSAVRDIVFLETDPLAETIRKVLKTRGAYELAPAFSELMVYAPRAFHQLSLGNELQFNNKLSSTYYANSNYFFRLTVIRSFKHQNTLLTLALFKEFWQISDLGLKYELLQVFNKFGEKPDKVDHFYFEELCMVISDELIYSMSAQNDLQLLADNELQASLKAQHILLVKVLFQLLNVLYEPTAIKVIYDIIANEDDEDIESKLFAIELLDNTLDELLKAKLAPIFEPAPFEQKLTHLQKFVPVETMSQVAALKNLLLKDYNLVNHYLKECCLRCYFQLTNDGKVLNSFKESQIENLKQCAEQLSSTTTTPIGATYSSLTSLFEETYHLSKNQLTYLLNEGFMRTSGKDKKHRNHPYFVAVDENSIIDSYALALLIETPN